MLTANSVSFSLSSGVIALLAVVVVFAIGMVIYRKLSASAADGRVEAPAAVPITPAVPAPIAPVAPAPITPVGNDDAIIAAITAAIAATLAAENGGQAPAFRVVSFRKIPTVSERK